MPNYLFALHQGSDSNGQLWYFIYDGEIWSQEMQVPNVSMAGSPGAAIYGNNLFCLYPAASTSDVQYVVFNGYAWSQSMPVPGAAAQGGTSPFAITMHQKLYCLYQGQTAGQLVYCVYDGTSWSQSGVVPGVSMSESPAAVMVGELMYVFFQGAGDTGSGNLYYTCYNGLTWTPPVQVPAFTLVGSPSAVILDNVLYVFCQTSVGQQLDYATFSFKDGTWSSIYNVSGVLMATNTGPGVVVLNKSIVALTQSSTDSSLYATTLSGKAWGSPVNVTSVSITSGPSPLIANY